MTPSDKKKTFYLSSKVKLGYLSLLRKRRNTYTYKHIAKVFVMV